MKANEISYCIAMYYKHQNQNYNMALAYISPVLIKYHNGSLDDSLLAEVALIVKEVKAKNTLPPATLVRMARTVLDKLAKCVVKADVTPYSINYRLQYTL